MPKKILIVNDHFPPFGWAGAERVSYDQAHALAEQLSNDKYQGTRYAVSVFTTVKEKKDVCWNEEDQPKGDETFERETSLASRASERKNFTLPETDQAYTPQGKLRMFRVHANGSERTRAYRCLYNPAVLREFEKALREIKPDIVHFHNIHDQISFAAIPMARKFTNKVFMTAHDVMTFAYGKINFFATPDAAPGEKCNYHVSWLRNLKAAKKRFNPFRNYFIKKNLNKLTKIFCVSHALEQALNQNGIQNTTVIHNGIDLQKWDWFSPDYLDKIKNRINPEGKKIYLFVGRLSGNKGWHAILHAARIVSKKIPESMLLIVGPNSDPLTTSPDPILRNHVRCTGLVMPGDVRYYYRMSDVVVVPSVYLDPFPTVNLEALTCGKPVVGTCFGGTPEIIEDGVSGYIVNPLNTDQFAEKIISLLNNPELAKTMGMRGRERVEKIFSIGQQVQKLEAWYTD